MIDKIIYALLFLAALALAAKVAVLAIFAILLGGLIFRTKETLGLLLFGGFLTALAAAPLVTLGVVAAMVMISLYFKAKEKKAAVLALEAQPPEPDDT